MASAYAFPRDVSTHEPSMSPQHRTPLVFRVASFLQSMFPVRTGDTPFLYHSPRLNSPPRPVVTDCSRVVLSITPTPGFYTAICTSPSHTPLAFLHRPWTLDRRLLPPSATVLSCHKGFDEVLTVGNNVALASALGIVTDRAVIIQGYKNQPERTIGIVGPIAAPVSRGGLRDMILAEFGTIEGAFGVDQPIGDEERPITIVAIMNAFHPEEVDRVTAAAQATGLVTPHDHSGILYLTGAVREQGLQAALERNMAVVCVGHRACEEWGIRYLAKVLAQEWPSLPIDVVLEEEDMGSGGRTPTQA